jgi:hypothetical protein
MQVMPEEEGLQGVWFSAKVLKLKDKRVLVLYDELLTEDGHLLSSAFASGPMGLVCDFFVVFICPFSSLYRWSHSNLVF